jgi:hypothetical protein
MEQCLLGLLYEDVAQDPWCRGTFNKEIRVNGLDWPSMAHSMIGLKRMHHLRLLCEDVLLRGVPGDLIETGVWRGGACIMMRAVLKAYGESTRTVWCADSFEGLPPPDQRYLQDMGDSHSSFDELRVPAEVVENNFRKYGLFDNQVRLLKGWFKDTLPTAPIERLAILRLDGDMYQSTIEAITLLFDKLSLTGYVIVDDWALAGCRQAIIDFRRQRAINDPIMPIDSFGVYWQKTT